MAIFNKKEDTNKKAVASKKEVKKSVKKNAKPVKDKKAHKPTSDAGRNLTKAPARILLTPRVTEKAAYMTLNNAYVFEVATDATKRDIVATIHALYQVTPRKVNIVNRKPRAYVARSRNRRGTKSGMKKAYVFLKKGDTIDLA